MWKYYALLSAVFAALTAILAKVGVRDIDSNLATAIRTTVILAITIFLGIVVLHEQVSWNVIVGGLLIVGGSLVLLL